MAERARQPHAYVRHLRFHPDARCFRSVVIREDTENNTASPGHAREQCAAVLERAQQSWQARYSREDYGLEIVDRIARDAFPRFAFRNNSRQCSETGVAHQRES